MSETSSAQSIVSREDRTYGRLDFDLSLRGEPDGVPVLLLHGWPQTLHSWDLVAPLLTTAGLRTAAINQRGYSAGARPDPAGHPEAYSVAAIVGDALGVLDALDWSSAHVVGHDWGAVVAWALAAAVPDRVRSLTAISVPHPSALAQSLRTDPSQVERLSYADVFRAPDGLGERLLLADDAARLRAVYGGFVPEELVTAHLAALANPEAMSAVLAWYRANSFTDAAAPAITVPTTYVLGSQDIAFGPGVVELVPQWVHAAYTFVGLDGASHWLPEERPEEVAAAIVAQVRRVESGSSA